jgi:hypothetical protein
MTKHYDLKKHFEAILGRELVGPENGEVVVRERIASYTTDEGSTTSREIGATGDSTKACSAAHLLDVSGVARTGEDGTTEFMLSEFFCDFTGGNILSFQFPVNFVATPRSLTPVFVTALATPISDRTDVRIRVAAWNASGAPAPNTSFGWRCRVPYAVVPVVD